MRLPPRTPAQPDWMRGAWLGLLALAVIGLLIPLDPYSPIGQPALSGQDILQALSRQAYGLIKTAILWVPLGMLAAFAGRQRTLIAVTLALVPGLLLIGLPGLPNAQVRDALEILGALPGLALGLWLGAGTGRRDTGGHPPTRTAPVRTHPAPVSPAPAQEPSSGPATRPGRVGSGAHRQPEALRPIRARAGALGLGLMALALLGALDFPRVPWLLGALLLAYAALLWFRPLAWLVVVPAALPLLDLAPWTGRFFLDEFDLLLMMTLGMQVLHGQGARHAPRPAAARPLFVLFALSACASLLIGLQGDLSPDANAFVSYWSPWNGARVAKGLLWGMLAYLALRRLPMQREALVKWLSAGMILGLAGVSLVGLWERELFAGSQTGQAAYRIVSTFSSMHTGGGHIEAYLVAALPFLWLIGTRPRHLLLTAPAMLAVAYVMLYTVARGGVLASAVVLGILGLASARLATRTRTGQPGAMLAAWLGVLALPGMVLALGVNDGALQARFAQAGQDWQTRVRHWRQALDMRDDAPLTAFLGMGLGSFPRTYRDRGPLDTQPASFGFASEQGNTHFRLGTGETIYFAQRIPFVAGTRYQLELDARSRTGPARLDTPLCEKQLLNSRRCAWQGFDIPGDGAWHRLTGTLAPGTLGDGPWWRHPPVELSLHNPGRGGVVDVDNLRLLDPSGQDILCNGDFTRAGDCWFFKTHGHLPWHIKNLWVHLLFEQGWVGLLLFCTLLLVALYRLARAGWRGHRLAWAWLASLAGLLTVGMFDSLLDAPRLATLLVALLFLGAGHAWHPPSHAGGRGHGDRAAQPNRH
ncbi:MAG TPA: hypothetical protein PKH69_10180 [Thiobacillaceae bacterium]|nr:hypothetical protein [Thiobacillaceae bacterium]